MRLDFMLLADAATASPDGKLFIHGGGVSRIMAPMLPWTQPQIVLVARFEMDQDDDYETPHELQVSATDPDGAVLVPPSRLGVPPQPRPESIEGEERYMNMALGLASLMFGREGVYRFELRLDGELVRSLPLVVVAARISESGEMTVGRPTTENTPDT